MLDKIELNANILVHNHMQNQYYSKFQFESINLNPYFIAIK